MSPLNAPFTNNCFVAGVCWLLMFVNGISKLTTRGFERWFSGVGSDCFANCATHPVLVNDKQNEKMVSKCKKLLCKEAIHTKHLPRNTNFLPSL